MLTFGAARGAFGQATAPPSTSMSPDSLPISSLTPTTDVVTYQLRGTVLNAVTGLPVTRALVVGPSGAAEFTDSGGHVLLGGLTGTTANLTVQKPGFTSAPTELPNQSSPKTVTLTDPVTEATFYLYPLATISGRLVSLDSEPIRATSVTAYRLSFAQGYRQMVQAGIGRTDSRGVFRMTVPAGDYILLARGGVAEPETGLSILPARYPMGSASEGATFHLSAGEERSVRLEAQTGYPQTVHLRIPGVTRAGMNLSVTARLAGGDPEPVQARPNDDGTFELHLPPGTYILHATLRSMPQRGGQPTIAENAGGAVQVSQLQGATEGEAQLTVRPGGDNVVSIALAPQPVIPVVIDVQSDAPQPTTLAAAAADIDTVATPPPIPAIQLQSLEPGQLTSPMRSYVKQNGNAAFFVDAGRYRLFMPSSGQWHVVQADYGGADAMARELSVAPGASSATLHLVISSTQNGTLSGTVMVGDNPGRAYVYILPRGQSVQPFTRLRVSDSGTFTNGTLVAGEYTVLACVVACEFDPAALTQRPRLAGYAQNVTIVTGQTATLTLNAVPEKELLP